MPSSKWHIEPVFISRKPLPPDKNLNELEAVSNNALVHAIRQLSALVKVSEIIFSELTEECSNLYAKTVKVKAKLNNCQNIVNKLDHKKVQIRKLKQRFNINPILLFKIGSNSIQNFKISKFSFIQVWKISEIFVIFSIFHNRMSFNKK